MSKYKALLSPDPVTGAIVGLYQADMTMDQLREAINLTVTAGKDADKLNGTELTPDISAGEKVVFDKKRSDGEYSRLVITGGVGGTANHIKVSDPTNLSMDKNSIDAPVTSTWINQVNVSVTPDSAYTGHTNKTITVVATAATGSAMLGTDDITFSWADTEGKSGTFVVTASDWDTANNRLKEDIELVQGVKINFQGPAGHPDQNYMNKNDAFTIDCQTPVIQKAADVGLAQTDKWVHVGVASLTDPIATGGEHFVFSYGGKECDITLTGGSVSLSSLVEQINRSSKNPGVIASILNDGMGTATSYKLVLTGRQAGLENSIVIDTTKTKLHYGTTNTRTDSGAWEHAREASNSMCRVDDYPKDGAWIQRSSNEIGDVIDGVVVTLQGAGTTQITVQNNVTEMVNRIKQLVQSVNYCKQYIKDETKWGGGKLVSKVLADGSFSRETEGGGGTVPGIDGEVKASGAMIGNYGFQISQSNIDRLVTSVIFTREEFIRAMDNNYDGTHPGDFSKLPVTVEDEDPDNPTSQTGLYNKYLKDNGLEYTRLSDIGIASDPSNQGLYIVENSKLTEVLTKNPEAVIKLFTFVPPDEPPFQDNTKLDSKLRGRVPAPYKPFDDENERPFIRGFAQGMAYAMSDLTRTGDVIDPKTGAVIKPAKGIMRVLSENYSNIISGIDEKIARETKRISMVEARLTEKFSRLETLLSQLQNQQTKNAAALAQLDNKSSSS
jgi:flagellar capping protein FliD